MTSRGKAGNCMAAALLISTAFAASIVACFAPEEKFFAGLAIGAVDAAQYDIRARFRRVNALCRRDREPNAARRVAGNKRADSSNWLSLE